MAGNPRIGDYAKQGSDAQKARHAASQLTAAARSASPGNIERWIEEVRAEHPDLSDADVLTMAEARQSEHFRKVGAAAKRKALQDAQRTVLNAGKAG